MTIIINDDQTTSTLVEKIEVFKKKFIQLKGWRFADLLDKVPMKTWKTLLDKEAFTQNNYELTSELASLINLKLVSLKSHEDAKEIEGKLKISVGSLVSKYYGQEFKVDYGPNKPNLHKQLTKQGIRPTEEEWYVIKELESIIECFKDTAYLELDSFELDYTEQDKWALADSCNREGDAGQNTWEYLEHNGFSLLRMVDNNEYPISRALFYREGNDFGHAGCYSEMDYWMLNGDSAIDHTAYPLVTMLLAIICERKLDEVMRVEGFYGVHNEKGIWSNMSAEASYKKYGTRNDILVSLNMELPSNLSVVYSEYLGEYIHEESAVWLEGIQDHMPSDYDDLYLCEECNSYFIHDSLDYTDGVFPTRTGQSFCCCGCFESYYGV